MLKITVLSRTIKTTKLPDIPGFIEAMKKLGARVSTKEGTIIVDFQQSARVKGHDG